MTKFQVVLVAAVCWVAVSSTLASAEYLQTPAYAKPSPPVYPPVPEYKPQPSFKPQPAAYPKPQPAAYPKPKLGGYEYEEKYPVHPPKYQFQWNVKDDYSHNNYYHNEARDGENTVGEYGVLLPDGRFQIVKYTVDDWGFKADVQYEGEAKYDPPKKYGGGGYGQKPSGYEQESGGYPKPQESNGGYQTLAKY